MSAVVRTIVAFLLTLGLLTAAVPALASVHPGDELLVTVYDHPEMSGPYTVDSTDRISLPLIGMIRVSGLSTEQIAQSVQRSLGKYVLKPAVTVQLRTQVPVVFISGGPGGTLKYEPGMTLVAALGNLTPRLQPLTAAAVPEGAAAASSVPFADLQRSRLDLRRVAITRDDRSIGTFNALDLFAKGEGGPSIQAGDTISFTNKPVQVSFDGAVMRPGAAYLWADEPLADGLSQVGGLAADAATNRIALRRVGATSYISQGDAAWNAPATAGDALTVPVAPRVNVAGMVERPGAETLKSDSSLLSALYQAGGPNKFANLKTVQVVGRGATTTFDITRLVHGDTTQNPQLHDGDIVFVPEGHRIDVGQVFQSILNASILFRVR
jgi:protein involved in polysaccharide export with SLBB domain